MNRLLVRERRRSKAMKYSEDIVREITAELKKIPNVRYVCQKVGLGTSTFYRWMAAHDEFHKEVEGAKLMGRENINEAAKGVIISKIQEGDMNAAKYWLSRNDRQFISHERAEYHEYLLREEITFFERDFGPSEFEAYFKFYQDLIDSYEREEADLLIRSALKRAFDEDYDLIEIFFATYPKWRSDQLLKEAEEKLNDSNEGEVEDDDDDTKS